MAARWTATAIGVLGVAVVLIHLPADVTPRLPRRGILTTARPDPNPRFSDLARTIGWARQDRRYYVRVLLPLLDDLRGDLDDPTPIDTIQQDVMNALDRSERRRTRWM